MIQKQARKLYSDMSLKSVQVSSSFLPPLTQSVDIKEMPKKQFFKGKIGILSKNEEIEENIMVIGIEDLQQLYYENQEYQNVWEMIEQLKNLLDIGKIIVLNRDTKISNLDQIEPDQDKMIEIQNMVISKKCSKKKYVNKIPKFKPRRRTINIGNFQKSAFQKSNWLQIPQQHQLSILTSDGRPGSKPITISPKQSFEKFSEIEDDHSIEIFTKNYKTASTQDSSQSQATSPDSSDKENNMPPQLILQQPKVKPIKNQVKAQIEKELAEIQQCSKRIPGIKVQSKEILMWKAKIVGPCDSLYAGGIYVLNIQIPTNYPFSPPEIRFCTKIYHPNIHSDGTIKLGILKFWSPCLTIYKVLSQIRNMMKFPNLDNPADPHTANQYMIDRKQFESTAKEWKNKFAKNQNNFNIKNKYAQIQL